ncbi:hypothetical protein Bpfe_029639 [Biomphalaria pfeifferi]|uniref:Uncharacterized protein n=1 Tax=Biomphalaria pfeifferi TaxID=112525 RepID=A0AAD8AR66_BIOPF|nr:hypothetical protein Bpfe_029639 [Biomphalaria pfeifferi]
MPLFHCQTLEGFDCGGASNLAFRGFHHKRKMEMGLENQLEDFELEQRANLPKRPCLWRSAGMPENHCPNMEMQQPNDTECSDKNHLLQPQQNSHVSFQQIQNCNQSLTYSLKDSNFNPHISMPSSGVYLCRNSQHETETFLEATGIVKDSSSSLPRNMGSNNLAEHFLSRLKKREEEEIERNSVNNNNIFGSSKSSANGMEDDDDEMLPEFDFERQQCADSNQNGYQVERSFTESQGGACGVDMDPSSTAMDSDISPETPQYVNSNIPVSQPQTIEYGNRVRRCPSMSCSGLKPSPVSGRLHCHCSASWRGMYGIDNGYSTDYY